MPQTQKCRGVATKVYTDDDGALCVRYHDTVVASLKDGMLHLNSGGWRTATTKLRINQFCNEQGLSAFGIFQSKGDWFVSTPAGKAEFYDGMIVDVR